MAKIGKTTATIERHKTYGTPHKISGIVSKARAGNPRRIAEAFVREIAGDLGIAPGAKDLRFDKVLDTPLGTHVFFQQLHQGKPVTGAWIKIDIDKQGRVYNATNSCVPGNLLAKAKAAKASLPKAKPMTQEAAVAKAIAAVDATTQRLRADVTTEQVVFPVGKTVENAWKVVIPLANPPHDWRVYVSATDGSLLRKEDMLKMVAARGRVFDPNPVVTLNDTTLTESKPLPDAAYREVELPELAASGFLDGPFVTTADTKRRVKVRNRQFLFKRAQKGFTEVMAYFQIDRMQRYIQSLGFADVNRRPIRVDVAGSTEDNSFYSPATKALAFGTGGVDDAEDAEIILHEYGHSVQDAQVPGFGSSAEAGAMGEGFGDYLAASFFADRKADRLRPCVGSWDATAYSDEDPPNLRRLDSTKHYPRDVVDEVHADGEIWSACLWKVREKLGGKPADKLVLSHHFLIQRDVSFKDAVQALILADRQLNGGANEAAIREIFIQRGILKSAKSKRAGYDPFALDNRPHRRPKPHR
jgi:Zn-dependent metalloprotease